MKAILEVQDYLTVLQGRGNLERLPTGFDNKKLPIHRWFPFYAGFSSSIVDKTIKYFDLSENDTAFDPFMGSGTTGVSCNEANISFVGNEINPFLFQICKTKLVQDQDIVPLEFQKVSEKILEIAAISWENQRIDSEHEILKACYPEDNLKKLVTLRTIIQGKEYERYYGLLYVILSRCLIPSTKGGNKYSLHKLVIS